MEMFLAVLALSFLGVAVSGMLFAAATRGDNPHEMVTLRARKPAPAPSRFFVDSMQLTPAVPVEVLLLQLEQHVRLEQAAAEAFLHAPTAQALHSRTMSPLVH